MRCYTIYLTFEEVQKLHFVNGNQNKKCSKKDIDAVTWTEETAT